MGLLRIQKTDLWVASIRLIAVSISYIVSFIGQKLHELLDLDEGFLDVLLDEVFLDEILCLASDDVVPCLDDEAKSGEYSSNIYHKRT